MDFMGQGNAYPPTQQQGGQLPPHHSMQYNMRNNLLHDDIGNIDISKETPINGPPQPNNQNNPQQFANPPQQQRPYPNQGPEQFNNNNNTTMNQQYPPQQQYYNNNPMNNPINNNMNMNMNMSMNQQYQNNTSYPQRQQQRHRAAAQAKQEKKTYSLNQKSFTNFFKAKNHGFGIGNKSKRSNGGGGSGDDDEDGEVLIDDPDSSTITFNDIQKFGYKNGDKLNVSEDTTPLVPTLVTKQSNNMTNTEYRKYLNTQKKNALTAFNNQNKNPNGGPGNNNNANMVMNQQQQQQPPRAMSLQAGFNGGTPYLMQQQQQMTRQQNGMSYSGMNISNQSMNNINSNNGNMSNMGGPRANSLMTGKPPMSYLQQQQQQQQVMPPQNNMNQPRTMSLTTNPNEQYMRPGFNNQQQQQQFMNNQPNRGNNMNQRQQVNSQYRTMSLQQRPNFNMQQSMNNQFPQNQMNTFRNQMASPQQGRVPSNGQIDIEGQSQNQIQGQEQGFDNNGPTLSSNNPYLESSNNEVNLENNNQQSKQQPSRINKISPPQLQSHASYNTASTNDSEFVSTNSQPSSMTSVTDLSLNEVKNHVTSPLRQQVDNEPVEHISPVNQHKPKLSIIQLSKPKQDELEQEKIMNDIKQNTNTPEVNEKYEQERIMNDIEQEMNPTTTSDVAEQEKIMDDIKKEMNPFSTKVATEQASNITEPDLRPSSLLQDGLSSLSLKDKTIRDSTMTQVSSFSISPVKHPKPHNQEIYKLANNTDSKAFVTAEEFPSSDHANKSSKSVDNVSRRDPRRDSAISIARASKRISIYKSSTRSPSTTSLASSKVEGDSEEYFNQIPNSPLTIIASRTTSRIDTGDKISASESHLSAIDDTFDYRNIPAESQPESAQNKTESRPQPDEKEAEDFVFDNTLYSPYKDISNTAPKHIMISKEQMGLLNENKRLMNELTLLSSELAESIKRETLLDERINIMKEESESNSKNHRFSSVSTSSISYTDFENELRRKSAKVVELIQALNEERMKRFIAEEQVLLKENNVSPSSLDLIKKVTELEAKLQEKETAISDLKLTLNKL